MRYLSILAFIFSLIGISGEGYTAINCPILQNGLSFDSNGNATIGSQRWNAYINFGGQPSLTGNVLGTFKPDTTNPPCKYWLDTNVWANVHVIMNPF